jgi:hypothetical protein
MMDAFLKRTTQELRPAVNFWHAWTPLWAAARPNRREMIEMVFILEMWRMPRRVGVHSK